MRKPLRGPFLALAIFGAASPAPANTPDCIKPVAEIFTEEQGTPMAWTLGGSAEFRKLIENSKLRSLGRGASGEVIRVIPNDSARPSWILKVLRDGERDQALFDRLHAICPSGKCGFRIAKSELLPSRSLGDSAQKIEDVHGRSLYSIMTDPKVDDALKNRLESIYHENLDRLSGALTESGHRVKREAPQPVYFISQHRNAPKDAFGVPIVPLDGLPMIGARILGDHPRDWAFLLKSDNVIVDPITFEMTIVDPF